MKRILAAFLAFGLVAWLAGMVGADDDAGAIRKDVAVNLDFQNIEPDLRPHSEDPTCQEDLLCTSFQIIEKTTIGPIKVRSRQPLELFVSFNGNYNCDECNSPPSLFPFLDVQLVASTDGGPFEQIVATSNYLPNSGADTVLRRLIELGRGDHTLQLRHRYQVFPTDPEDLTVNLLRGAVRIEQLKRGSQSDNVDN